MALMDAKTVMAVREKGALTDRVDSRDDLPRREGIIENMPASW